jgi:hypothetical protein
MRYESAKKSAITDSEGNAQIDEVKSGKDTLAGVLNNKVIYTGNVVIKKGTTNHYNLLIETL